MADDSDEWPPIPDQAALLLGRLTFYAAWLDDTAGSVTVHASENATDDSASTPKWAASGVQLVDALKPLQLKYPPVKRLVWWLENLNPFRNHWIHGTWWCHEDRVTIVKRDLAKGQRLNLSATVEYADIERVIDAYRRACALAEEISEGVHSANPVSQQRDLAATPLCPDDETPMEGFLDADEGYEYVWQCPTCDLKQPI